ncbi:MAG: hypothetical protein FD144_5434 [Rhodospirillaceae bacterium]|nr:MAG: hypothetical protein FD144_5434 [Rhodospirillaceae bacterium]
MSRTFHSLLIKSSLIQSKIERERGRPTPDWIMLLRLKLLRLRLKSRLEALSAAALRPPMPQTSLAFARV